MAPTMQLFSWFQRFEPLKFYCIWFLLVDKILILKTELLLKDVDLYDDTLKKKCKNVVGRNEYNLNLYQYINKEM